MLLKDLALLEFPRIRSMIADYCSFELSREKASALDPSTDISRIHAWLKECAEARTLLEMEPGFSIFGLSDISQEVHSTELGRILETKKLAEIRRSLGVLRHLKSKLSETAAETPLLTTIAAEIGDYRRLEKNLERTISPEGELMSDASDKLTDIRRKLRHKRSEITDKLQHLIESESSRRFIQEPIITEREGRFSIAVKAEYKGEIKGIVHDVSNSGATVFVEPFAALESGNELKELEIAEGREIERILTELSAEIGRASKSILAGLESAAIIDLALAKALYARRAKAVEAVVYQPSPSEPAVIKLDNARHPLLGGTAVPLSLELGRDYSILVITGPNTGGKTVALKTIGLLCLMAQAGLPVPAEPGTTLPVFNGIYADIGDEQSVQEALSTFSGHVSNIARILHHMGEGDLVLLDELGASTDPQEGSALARAILLRLHEMKVLGTATSHYADLKAFAHATAGMQNASFEFDPQTLEPTYQLTLGIPGGSNAIATAARFGMPESVIKAAKNMLEEGSRQLEKLLNELQAEKTRFGDLNKLLEREKADLTRQNQRLAEELRKIKDEKQTIIRNARDSIVEEMAVLQKELKQAHSLLKKERSFESLAMARKVSELARAQLKHGIWQQEAKDVSTADDNIIKIGDTVWLKEAEIEASVVDINQKSGQIEVAAGPVRFKLEKSGVVKINGPKSKNTEKSIGIRSADKYISLELDLRGKRADDIEPLLDEYLNSATSANLTEVRIIHGFGKGVVRDIVREQSARHPLVASFRSAPSDQGGDGATVLRLK